MKYSANKNLVKFLGCFIAFALLLSGSVFASLTPATLEAVLAPGQSVTEAKTVAIPAMPPKADVVFAFDLTGSMTGVINTAKAQAGAIMTALDALGVDIDYGVMSYMDYPYTYDSYGYYNTYGDAGSGDYPYRLDQAVTSDNTAVTTAINSLIMGYGADGPESYTRVLYESYADPAVGWRAGAKRIIINFGDNIPHDDNVNEGIPADVIDWWAWTDPWSTGGDPGRDNAMYTSDDLDLQAVLGEMAAAGVTLIACQSYASYLPYWEVWAEATGGAAYDTTAETLPADIVAAIETELNDPNITGLTLVAEAGYETWLTSVAPESYSGETGVTTDFEIVITVPVGTPLGTYTFTISAVDAAGVVYGTQTVTIKVVCLEIEIDVKPTLNLKNKGSIPVILFGNEYFDVTTIEWVEFAGSPALDIGGGISDRNHDGYNDILLHFATEEVELTTDDTEAKVIGVAAGVPFCGSGPVKVIK